MNHFANNGKEYLRKTNYRDTQGRTPKQMENNYKVVEWTFVGGIVVAIIYLIGSIVGQW